jgi:methionyl-tRNA formyltransferase
VSSLKVIFFGTPDFAAQCLEALLEHGINVVAVVTQPDRPKGRSLQLTASAVKNLVQSKAPQIPILQPEKASQALEIFAPFQADLFVVVAYGQILSQKLLDVPRLGCINVHASLLPKYRGAAPIQRCLMAGDVVTGVSIQKMVRQMDAGDVIAESQCKIPLEMTFDELHQALIDLSRPLLLHVIQLYAKGIPSAQPQDPALVTFAAKVELEEGEIDWKKPAPEIHNLIRAFSSKPGAWCWISSNQEKKRLKILRSRPVQKEKHAPGKLLTQDGLIACGEGALLLIEVQPEGKKAMKASDWLRGQKNISFDSA